MAYFKITLKPTAFTNKKTARTFCIQTETTAGNGHYLGYEVDPKTGDSKNCFFKGDTLIETKRFVHKDAIAKVTQLYENLKYGGLTTKTPEEQKIEYGL